MNSEGPRRTRENLEEIQTRSTTTGGSASMATALRSFAPRMSGSEAGASYPSHAMTDVERSGARLGFEALAEHDLKNVAGVDVLARLRHGGFEFGLREVRGERGA